MNNPSLFQWVSTKVYDYVELYFASNEQILEISLRNLRKTEEGLTLKIEDIDFDTPFVQKAITGASKKQDREAITREAKILVRMKRQKRQLEKHRSYIDGMIIQIETVKMSSLLNDNIAIITECIEAMPNMSSHEERRANLMKFQMQMESLKMSTAVKAIVEQELEKGSMAILERLPHVNTLQQKNPLATSSNPSIILQDIDRYTKNF